MRAEHRQQVIANMLDHHGPSTLRELGERTGHELTEINRDLLAMEDAGLVKREEIEGWRLRGSKTGQYRWSLDWRPIA